MRWAGCQSDFDTPLTKSFNCNCFSCLFRLFTSMICRCRDVRWRKLWPCSRLIRPKRRTPLSWPLRWHRPRFRSDLTICRQRDTELFSGWCLLETNCNIVIFLFNCWDVVVVLLLELYGKVCCTVHDKTLIWSYFGLLTWNAIDCLFLILFCIIFLFILYEFVIVVT